MDKKTYNKISVQFNIFTFDRVNKSNPQDEFECSVNTTIQKYLEYMVLKIKKYAEEGLYFDIMPVFVTLKWKNKTKQLETKSKHIYAMFKEVDDKIKLYVDTEKNTFAEHYNKLSDKLKMRLELRSVDDKFFVQAFKEVKGEYKLQSHWTLTGCKLIFHLGVISNNVNKKLLTENICDYEPNIRLKRELINLNEISKYVNNVINKKLTG